jgi:hypothetical protein
MTDIDEEKKYATLQPPYPQRAYFAAVFVQIEGDVAGVVPFIELRGSVADCTLAIREVLNQMQLGEETKVPDYAIVVPISLINRYPLRREFWEAPDQQYTDELRIRAFLPALNHPEFYHLIVTPWYHDEEKSWTFSAAIPKLSTSNDDIVEQFMLHSTMPVDIRATDAAIYQMEAPLRLNWKTGKILSTEKNAPADEDTNTIH